MRLWHSKLIPFLDSKRLCDLHMSCCNLRGKGWGKRNAAVGYLYEDPLGEDALAVYHHRVLNEMSHRGFKYDSLWELADYCGKNRAPRTYDPEKYLDACVRNVALLGHTLEIFVKDVAALRERGLDISYYADPIGSVEDPCGVCITLYNDAIKYTYEVTF